MDEEQTYRMELQYEGTDLYGWARQPGLATVEESLGCALATVLGRSPTLRVAGRTDAGVHARLQVASLRLPGGIDASRLVHSLNALTPPSISIMRLQPASLGFDARKDAVSRSYRYFLQIGGVDSPFHGRYLWRVAPTVQMTTMREAAALVEGRHDFRAFTPTETEHVFFRRRVSRCRWVRWGTERYALEIEAESFLRHMVRTLVGTMVAIGVGERPLDDLSRLLEGASREEAGLTAPARGLFLWDIKYPDAEDAQVRDFST